MAKKNPFEEHSFNSASAPRQPKFGLMQTGNFELQGVEGGDYVSAAASGFTQLGEAVGGVAEYAGIPGGAEFAEASRKGGEYWREDMTPAGKLAMNREWADTTEDAAWKDIDTWLLNLTQAAPMTAAAMTPVGVAARAGAGATKLAAIGAGAETFLGAGITQSTISGEIDKMKPDELKSLAESQGLDIGNMKAPEFKQMVKDRASRLMVPGVGLASGALGAISGPIQGKLFVPKNIQLYRKFAAKEGKEKAAKYILKKIAKGDGTVKEWVKRVGQGTAVEAIQEGMQEGVEHAGSQVALNRDPTEGLAESMVAGAALGAGMGGPATAASRASLPKDIQAALDYESKKEGPSTEPGAPPTQGIPTETTSFPPITGGAPPAPAPFVGPANENFPPINKVPNIDEVVAPQEEEGFPEVVDIPIDPKAHKGFPSIIDNAIGKVEPPKKTKQKKVTAKTAKAIAKSKGGVPKKSEKGPKVETKDMSAGPEKMESLAEDLEKINEGMKVTAEKQRIKKEKTAKAIAKEMETKPKPSTKKTGLVKDIIKDDRMSFNRMKVVGNSIKQKGKDGKWKNVSKDKSGDARQEYMTDVNVAVQAAVAEMNNLRKSGATEAQVKKVEALISSVASYERLDSKTGGPTREWSVRGEMKSYSKGTSFSAPAINKFLKNIETEIGRVERNVNLKADKVGGETTRTARVKATKKVKAEQRQARKDTTAKAEAAIVAKKASNKRATDKKASEQAVKDKRDDESVTHGTKHRGKVAPTVDAKTGIDKRARDVLSIVMGTENYTDSELAKKLGVELEQISRQSRAFLKKMINHQPLNKLTPEQIDLKNKLFDEFMGAMGSDQSITKQLAKVTTADRTITKKLKKDAGIAQSGTTAEEFTDFELFGKQMKQFMNTLKAKYAKDFDSPAIASKWVKDVGEYIRAGVEGKHRRKDMEERLVEQEGLTQSEFNTVMDFVDTIQERKGAAVPEEYAGQVDETQAKEEKRQEEAEAQKEAINDFFEGKEVSEADRALFTADLEAGLPGFEIEGETDIYGVDYRASGYDEINIDVNELENQQDIYGRLPDSESFADNFPDIIETRKAVKDYFLMAMGTDGKKFGPRIALNEMAEQIHSMLNQADPMRQLFKILADTNITDPVAMLTDAQTRKVTKADESFEGFYSEQASAMGINEMLAESNTPGEFLRTVAHEMVHAATLAKLEAGGTSARQLQALYQYADNNRSDLKSHYGYTNEAEFLAEALSNPTFQRELSKIKLETTVGGQTQTLWTKFVETVRNMLGLDASQDSILAHVMALAPELITNVQERALLRKLNEPAGSAVTPRTASIDKLTSKVSDIAMEKADINFRSMSDSAKQKFLRFMTLDGVTDKFKEAFKEGAVETFYRNTKEFAKSPVEALQELRRLKANESTKRTAESKKHDQRLKNLQKELGPEAVADLGQLMNEATLSNGYVDLPSTADTNSHLDAEAKIAHDALHERFNRMPKKLQSEYKLMEGLYKTEYQQMREASIDNLAQISGHDITGNANVDKLLKDLKVATTADEVNKAFASAEEAFGKDTTAGTKAKEVYSNLLANAKDMKKVVHSMNRYANAKGPYFPLKRYGKYSLYGIDPTTGEKHFFRSDDRSELEAQQQLLRDKGIEAGAIGIIDNNNSHFSARNMASVLEAALSNAGDSSDARKIAREAILKAFISLAPETSIQKQFMKRTGVAGASTAVRRNMASYTQAVSSSIAGLKYSTDINTALGAIRKHADKDKTNSKVDDRSDLNIAAIELARRVNEPAQPTGKFMQTMSGYSFVNFLMSVSYSVVNSTQVATVTLPRMSEQYGIGESAKALKDAYALIAPEIGTGLLKSRLGGKAWTTGVDLDRNIEAITKKLSGGEAEMMQTLRDRDMLGGGLTFDIAESAKGKDGSWKNTFIEMGRTAPMMIEEMNRTVTALATYKLERENGSSHDVAIRAAEKMIIKTHFDYSDLNKPPVFTLNDATRAMSLYKMHPLGLYMNLAHYVVEPYNLAKRKLKGGEISQAEFDSAKAKMKGFGMFMGMHSVFAGMAGGILLEPIRIVMAAVAASMDDDDEDKVLWQNPDLMMRETLFNLGMGAKASEVFTYGMPRALGMDWYDRIGAHRMLVQMGQGDSTTSAFIDGTIKTLAGPMASIYQGYGKAADHRAAGDGALNSVSYMLPKLPRDIIRAFGQYNDGLTDYSGNTIYPGSEFGVGSAVVKGLGFSTSTEAEVRSNRNRDRTRQAGLRATNTRLKRQWKGMPTGNEKRAFFNENIRPFNEGLTTKEDRKKYRLTESKLRKSTKAQEVRVRKTRQGVYSEKPTGMYPYSTLDR